MSVQKLVIVILLVWFTPIKCFPQKARMVPFFAKTIRFSSPLGLVKAPGMPEALFVLEQRGMIYQVLNREGASVKAPFLDFREFVSQEGSETGLLGLAFHPLYKKNGRFFLSYTGGKGKNLKSYIVELQSKSISKGHKTTEKPLILISVAQPYTNHNGGAIAFGPDGFLYFSWGDGGAGGDPGNRAQDLTSFLGKIHRIDVNRKSDGKNYAIPASNPFAGNSVAKPEIFAYGLRNVWQMKFDPQTGHLWAGDVGQNAVEEIDKIESGKNYGWRIREGNSDFRPEEKKEGQVLAEPVFAYPQENGDQSVTGGLVYHGSHKEWQGKYIFGDFMSGRIWILAKDGKSVGLIQEAKNPRISLSCFGETPTREVLVCDYSSGKIYVLKP